MALPRPSQCILLVEDDANDVFLFERALRAADIDQPLRVVSDGESALAYLEGQKQFSDRDGFPLPSLVFLDLKLPTVSGFEVLTWIRHRAHFRRIKVVVLTGSPLTIDIYRALELGANAYLVKPISSETLSSLGPNLDISRLPMRTPPPCGPSSKREIHFGTRTR